MSEKHELDELEPGDIETIARARVIYQTYSPHDVDLASVMRRPRRGPILATAAAVAAVLSATAIGLALGTGSSGHPTGPSATTPAGSVSPDPAPDEGSPLALERDLYRVLDAQGITDYFMLQVDGATKTATIWQDQPNAAVLESIASRAGYQLIARALPPADTWSPTDEEALSVAANQIRARLRQAPASGFTALKLEVPLKTLVVWRTTPDTTVDADLRSIASAQDITLELRTAPMSKADAERLGEQLRQATGTDGSFTVLGAYATGSGAIVTVTGDLDAAKAELDDQPGVFFVQLDRFVDAPGTRN